MQKLSGAKEKLGLRVHGLIIGSPEKKRADPAVLRALCTNYLPNGKVEQCMSEFEGWASVQVGGRVCVVAVESGLLDEAGMKQMRRMSCIPCSEMLCPMALWLDGWCCCHSA
jgi:hypothetical protein